MMILMISCPTLGASSVEGISATVHYVNGNLAVHPKELPQGGRGELLGREEGLERGDNRDVVGDA